MLESALSSVRSDKQEDTMLHRIRGFAIGAVLLLIAGCDSNNIGTLPGPGADGIAPVMGAITGIGAGDTVSGSLAITAAATDNIAVTSLKCAIGATELGSSTNGSLSFSWDTTGTADGTASLVFTAGDAAGNDVSTTINVTVDNGGGGGGGASVSGTVFMPNGDDPVSGALVYVPSGGASAAALGDPPGEANYDFDYTGADGSFSLSGIPAGDQTLRVISGAFSLDVAVNLLDGNNSLDPAQTTLPAESGGGVNAGGGLVLGTETFDMVDGDGSLPDADYPNFDTFFATETNFASYRTIFLNCGNNFEAEFFADTAAVDTLKAWVNDGGKLYCTDWSYDFCEQLFPQHIDFYSTTAGDGLSTTAELPEEAAAGADITELACPVVDANLLEWLQGIAVPTTAGAINVTDWLVGWVPIEAVGPAVKVWVTGDVTYGFPEATNNRPVTVTFGSGDGTVLFSSYHTESSPVPGLTPQDRVLQYLIFEVL
jgi:Bacterial Ig domain